MIEWINEARKGRERYNWLSLRCKNVEFHERNITLLSVPYIVFLFVKSENMIIL